MVPLVAPCHVVAASVWDCDNCIPVEESAGLCSKQGITRSTFLTTLSESLVDNHSMLGCRQHKFTYVGTSLFTPVLQT